ncbi:MAG: type II toxin-antitoxin system VapC family toxin [Fimbriimonadales bacterium]
MVIDSSALVAMLMHETEAAGLRDRLRNGTSAIISPSSLVESGIVLTRLIGENAWAEMDVFLNDMGARTEPFTHEHASAAHEAFLRFGKGRHPAGLNFGDCMAYAVAKVAGLPLLYVGDDFSQTDIEPA